MSSKVKMKSPRLEQKFEEAVQFLVQQMRTTDNNSKPEIWHSIKVGMYLYNQNYNERVVIAGLLHDLLEESETVKQQIKNKFGKKVAELVESNTLNTKNPDKLNRSMEMFNKCLSYGKDALIIKAADILDNSDFFIHADMKTQNYLMKKWQYFLNISKPLIENALVWKKLKKKVEQL